MQQAWKISFSILHITMLQLAAASAPGHAACASSWHACCGMRGIKNKAGRVEKQKALHD
jgi:hypothetical protein